MYLNCKTYYSYRYGTFSLEQLIQTAVESGVKTMALTNINNTGDTWNFVSSCRKADIKPVAGAEIRNEDTFCYVLLAKNNEGFYAINRFISHHVMQKLPFPERPQFNEDVLIIYALKGRYFSMELLDNEYIGVQTTEANLLFKVDMAKWGNKLVIRHPVTFQDTTHYELHRLLRAIDHNILITKQTTDQYAAAHETFLPPNKIMEAFSNYQQLITNTFLLLSSCSISMDFGSDKNQKTVSRTADTDRAWLRRLALDGVVERYGPNNQVAMQRVLKELKIIDELNFNAYFLINYDLVSYAKGKGYFHVGRGSGANSIVAYCLQITDVDPIDLDLYFERFLNPYRASPPDFDIDFSHLHRDKMFEYIFDKYGADHVVLLGSYSTFKKDAAIRELGKVFGLPPEEINKLTDGQGRASDRNHQRIQQYGNMLIGFPNYLSVHPCAMLISEKPIHYYTATILPPKGFPVTQFDMFVAEDIGLFKFDILSQRGLSHIMDAIQLIKEQRGIDVNIHAIQKFKQDPLLAKNIQEGNTVGCFYIESPSMRQLLKKLRCRDYLTLVAASSIIRPGVSSSGMMAQYIQRFHNPDQVEYLHPKLKELLSETYGVMVYQEDVIKVAHHYAGIDMAKADVLRRAMSGKHRGPKEMQQLEIDFFESAAQLERPIETTTEVWRQISSFAGYSFSKAHSASFAVESYQSLYLKTYFPVEFMVAVINNFGGFYNRALYFQQLVKHGATVHNPCINHSEYMTSIQPSGVYVGFVHIQALQEKLITSVIEERRRNGHYLHLQDFFERTQMPIEQVNILIKVNAFRFTGKTKAALLWEATSLQPSPAKRITVGPSLFNEPELTFELPALRQNPFKDMLQDQELLGLSLRNMFNLVDDNPCLYQCGTDIPQYLHKTVTCLLWLICTKNTYTKNAQELMHFGTWIDYKGDWVDTVHFPDSAKQYPFQKNGFYKVTGEVLEEFGVFNISVTHMEKIGIRHIE